MSEPVAELRRRKVVRFAVMYVIVGWVVIEVASTVLTNLQREFQTAA